ncbi:unnamed protein product [Dicrocoelium dendriticum]|nr:unnamed protein product [Dicrocoelium dendriticum]
MNFYLPLGLSCFEVVRSRFSDWDSAGLSKIPPSIICASRLLSLRQLSHLRLCQYIDVVREKPERLFVVSETYSKSLEDFIDPVSDVEWLTERLTECLDALDYLDQHHLVHVCLNPSKIMLNFNGTVKINGFGLYYATHWGYDVDFPIIDPIYSAPETFLTYFLLRKNDGDLKHSQEDPCPLHIVCDMWSLGLIFLELIYGRGLGNPLRRRIDSQLSKGSNELASSLDSTNQKFAASTLLEGLRLSRTTKQNFADFLSITSHIDPTERSLKSLEDICLQCLMFNPALRPVPSVVMCRLQQRRNALPLQPKIPDTCIYLTAKVPESINTKDSCIPRLFDYTCHVNTENNYSIAKAADFLYSRSDLTVVYYYWCLTGGNLKSVWEDSTVYHPASSEVSHVSEHWSAHHQGDTSSSVSRIILLPFQRLLERISKMSLDALYPLLVPSFELTAHASPVERPTNFFDCGCLHPDGYFFENFTDGPVIRLQPTDNPLEDHPNSFKAFDVEYQVRRVCLFKRLLNGLPATEFHLRLEARKDIPPLLRSHVWAALLGIHRDGSFRERYAATCVATACGREVEDACELGIPHYGKLDEKSANQISVDLPRCHAYDALLASPSGHASLRQVLVSTLSMQPTTLEYTQGMDSVAAVFVRLCYPDDALAAACLQALFSTKLSHFFAVGQFTAGLKAFFNILLRLFAFHAPALAVCLTDLNVPLVGLTTGWVYTLFSHAMPLDRTEVIWDTLIAGPPSLPMFFYIAVFLQLDQQINFESIGLEKICTVLSNFPDIDLDKCRSDALRFAVATPVSLTLGPGLHYRSTAKTMTATTSPSSGLPTERVHPSHSNSASSCLTARDPTDLGSTDKSSVPRCCLSFYERLSTPNSWPCHLELGYEISRPSTGADPNLPSSTMEPSNVWVTEYPLVSLLSPEDALEHLLRPDCFVLDVRDPVDFSKGFITGSVHRSPTQLPSFTSAHVDSGAKSSSFSSHSFPGGDWELVEGPGGSRRFPRVVHPFLVDLTAEAAWIQASEARREAVIRRSRNKRTSGIPNSPGLIIIIGYGDRFLMQEPMEKPTSILVASWLIHHGVARVCVLKGGASALLGLTAGKELFVHPVL